MRNPARVLPEPVGAATRVCSPAEIGGQAASCAGVGPCGKRSRNQAATAGCSSTVGSSEVSTATPPRGRGSNSDSCVGADTAPPYVRPVTRLAGGRRGRRREDGAWPTASSGSRRWTTWCCAAPTWRPRWPGTSTGWGWPRSGWRSGAVPFPSVRISPTAIIDLVGGGDGADGRLDHFCIAVSPTDLAALAAARGLDVVEGPVPRFGAQGEATSIYVRDPDGCVVE